MINVDKINPNINYSLLRCNKNAQLTSNTQNIKKPIELTPINYALCETLKSNIVFKGSIGATDNISQDYGKATDLLDFLWKFETNNPNFTSKTELLENLYTIYDKKHIEECSKFAKKINVNELKRLLNREYSREEVFQFIEHHTRLNPNKPINKENLTFKKDMTDFLRKNYINSDNLDELLNFYPQTPRNVGQIPADWLDNIKVERKQAEKDVYLAIQMFCKSRNSRGLASRLSKALNKNVEVKRLESGEYGYGYLINIEGAKKTCLKVFKETTRANDKYVANAHGQYIEPQTALFANEHYGEDFTRFYFGKIEQISAKTQDAFMVTEFLDQNGRKKLSEKPTGNYRADDCLMSCHDCNQINGIIYDYGAIIPLDDKNYRVPSFRFEDYFSRF